jgi:hypothetical protein
MIFKPLHAPLYGLVVLAAVCFNTHAAELAGVTVDDEIVAANGDKLQLNGMGLRELWVDVYVGSLYLQRKTNNVADVLSRQGPIRIQMDFIYTEVASKKLIKAWQEGFEKNQSEAMLKKLQNRIEQFYDYFSDSAKKGDQYILDYLPGSGTQIIKNGALLGTIEGDDFKNALLEIWLGNFPADKGLKKGMLGLNAPAFKP